MSICGVVEGIAYGIDAAMEGGQEIYSMRLRLILSAAELFQLLSNGQYAPIKHTIIASDTIQDRQFPSQNSVTFYYMSHNVAFKNLMPTPIKIATHVPYRLNNTSSRSQPAISLLAGGSNDYVVREGSELAAYQLGSRLEDFEGSDAGEVVQGLKLIQFEVATPPSPINEVNLSQDLIRVTLTLNVRVEGPTIVTPRTRFFLARGIPDLAYAPGNNGTAVFAAVNIIQLPDEGYPYVGIEYEEITKFGVLYWFNAAGKQSVVRIRNIEDPNNRLVVPALEARLESLNDFSDYKWLRKFTSCELGYNEDHGWWNVMQLTEPLVFEEGSDHTSYWDVRPKVANALTPVFLYNRIRPTVISKEMPTYPLKEVYDVVPLRHSKFN